MSLRSVEFTIACPLILAAFPHWDSLGQKGVKVNKTCFNVTGTEEKLMGILFPIAKIQQCKINGKKKSEINIMPCGLLLF